MKIRTLKRRHDVLTLRNAVNAALINGSHDVWLHDDPDDLEDWDDDQNEAHCFDCGELHDMCECHIGAECGRWRNGRLSDSCMKAGSEECDFECPYGR